MIPKTTPQHSSHYQALDGLRGIAALSIFVLHKIGSFNTHLNGIASIQNFYLAVDFFFVLSGFVMALNYQERLMTQAISIKKFMLLRLGRIYPLQLALTLFYGIKTLLFSGGHKSINFLPGMGVNLFMLQGIMPNEHFSWIGPSWSISTEFWTYILFTLYAAFILPWRRSRIFLALLSLCLLVVLGFAKGTINVYFTPYALLRCVAGFSLGVLLFNLWPQIKKIMFLLPPNATEFVIAAIWVGFITFADRGLVSLLAPFGFAMLVAVFGFERGVISVCLKTYPLQQLGKLSYSIYMIHFLFTEFYLNIFHNLIKHKLFTDFTLGGTDGIFLGNTMWRGDLYFLMAAVGLILASCGTYCYIEEPAREWVRNRLKMMN